MRYLQVSPIALVLLAACTTPSSAPSSPPELRVWSTMREAIGQGNSEGRVVLADAVRPTTMGVGALAGLKGEVTILGGRAYVAQMVAGEMRVRRANDVDQATMLVAADVASWQASPLPACASFDELEEAIAGVLEARDLPLDAATPFRVTGTAKAVNLHVIDGACPIANPEGTPPGRLQGENMGVELVGFFIEGAATKLTHHNRRSHVHALTEGNTYSGHLDGVSLAAGAQLWLPAPVAR